jgi:hypothetical protein
MAKCEMTISRTRQRREKTLNHYDMMFFKSYEDAETHAEMLKD